MFLGKIRGKLTEFMTHVFPEFKPPKWWRLFFLTTSFRLVTTKPWKNKSCAFSKKWCHSPPTPPKKSALQIYETHLKHSHPSNYFRVSKLLFEANHVDISFKVLFLKPIPNAEIPKHQHRPRKMSNCRKLPEKSSTPWWMMTVMGVTTWMSQEVSTWLVNGI